MRIRCPSCSATYDVADALLARPRTVRCAKCAHDWMAEPVEDDPLPDEQPEAADEAMTPEAVVPVAAPVPVARARTPEPGPVFGDTPLSAIERLAIPGEPPAGQRRRDRLLTTAWALSFAALAATAVVAYTERNLLMRHWPASQRVYATLGLAPLDIKAIDVKSGNPKSPGQRPARP
jgi:predicted Zn finger-like uncharacterized protein